MSLDLEEFNVQRGLICLEPGIYTGVIEIAWAMNKHWNAKSSSASARAGANLTEILNR